MKTSIRAAAALCALALGLTGAAAAQAEPKAGGPVPLPYPNPPSAPTAKPVLAPEAAALRAKLVKAQADLAALASQPAPAGLGPRDAAALDEQQAADRRLAQQLQALIADLDGGAATGDVGQKLQFQLQEANSTYQHSANPESNVLKARQKAAEAILSKLN
jgi:hypothetical protein